MKKGTKFCLLVAGAVGFLLIVILFAISWAVITPVEFGLKINKITGKVDASRVFSSGRYFLGPGKAFLKFPATQRTIEFSNNENASSSPVITRTNNGVPITLSFSFQYNLTKENISSLYNKYAQAYESNIIKVARSNILQTAGSFDSEKYWNNRQEVTEGMLAALRSGLDSNFFLQIAQFQLVDVILPQAYEDSIINTQVQIQKKKTAEYQKQITAIDQQIAQIYAEADRNITQILANGTAESVRIENVAQTTAFNFTQNTYAEAFSYLQTTLKMNATQLLTYIKIRTIRDKSHSKGLKIGLGRPNIA